jgi:hypothetical protein
VIVVCVHCARRVDEWRQPCTTPKHEARVEVAAGFDVSVRKRP